tara:strand:+ start:34 stop:1944 length:1911 start_codon:yes stop_codon:yes gene_type:complete
MNEEEELKEEKERYERQNQEAYDEVTKGNEELRRRQEGSLDRRKRIYPDYKKNRSKNKPKFSGGSPGQTFIPGEEVQGPDDFDMRTGAPIYEQNKAINDAFRFDQPNRAFQQYKTISEYFPDLTDPKETSEFLVDMVTDAGIAVKTFPEVGTALKAITARRIVDQAFDPANSIFKRNAITVHAMGKGSQKGRRFGSKGFGSLEDIDDLDQFLLSKPNRFDVADESLRKANIDPKSPFYKRLRAAARQVPEFVRRNEDGFLYFDYNLFKDSMRPKQHGRAYIQLFESDLDTVLKPTSFAPDAGKGTKLFREFDIAEFRETFKPAAELLGLTGKKTLGRMDVSNVHHIAALKGTMGIYDGLGFNSPMFKKVNAAMKESLGGTGAERANLIRLVGGTADKGSPHQLAHFFLDEALGTRGENFFTEDVLLKMSLDDSYRISKARELGKIVADSEKVALEAQDAYKRLADAALATDFKDIQNTLERLVTSEKLGFVKLNNVNYKPIIRETAERGGYNVRQFDELIEDIALIHKAVPTGSPKLIDELLFSPQLLRSQKSFQKLVTKIEEKFGAQGVSGSQMRKILDAYDVRMQNAGLGQTGLFEDIPDNLIEDTLNSLDTKIKTRKTRRNQAKYKRDKDLNE